VSLVEAMEKVTTGIFSNGWNARGIESRSSEKVVVIGVRWDWSYALFTARICDATSTLDS
jgi:hypothetical protein